MKLETNLQLRQELKLKLAPQVIQSIEILQLPILELQDRIEDELLENPLLERTEELKQEEPPAESEDGEERQPADEPADPPEAGEGAADRDAPATADGEPEEFSRLEDLGNLWEDRSYTSTRGSHNDGEKDRKQEALDATPAPPITLEEHLKTQMMFYDLEPNVKYAADAIVANLDRRGYLSCPLEEIAQTMDRPLTMEELEEALRIVQSLEPPGVGAQSLAECLLLQLDDDDPDHEFTREIVTNWFNDLMKNRYPLVSRKTGRSIDDIKRVVEKIAELNPMPGSLFDETPAPHVSPDVRIELIDGRYEIILEDDSLPRVNLNRYYLDKLRQRDLDPATRTFLQKKVEAARWLLDAIEQRRVTLQRVVTEIVDAQKKFFEKGLTALRPLKMQEVADALGIHVSTVSRAIAKKYAQTPQGIFALKFFFTGGLQTATGEVESWDSVRQKLTEIMVQEDKSNPLSDEEIVKAFKDQGIEIARRTVTKYRKQLGIPSSRGRKQY